jgi:hypothetical protein
MTSSSAFVGLLVRSDFCISLLEFLYLLFVCLCQVLLSVSKFRLDGTRLSFACARTMAVTIPGGMCYLGRRLYSIGARTHLQSINIRSADLRLRGQFAGLEGGDRRRLDGG